MNLNTLFDKLTNFKIKFTENPSPVQVSNKKLTFILNKGKAWEHGVEFKSIELNKDTDTVEVILS